MLLSRKFGFLFVHLAKTGGTSIRAALTQQQWRDPWCWPTWVAHRASAWTGHRIGAKLPRHAPIIAARETLPPDYFKSLFKFGFVRNPWDRIVSAYKHFQRERQDVLSSEKIATFPEFVDHILNADPDTAARGALIRAIQRPQLESLVGLSGELLVDFVGRYESLASDFQDVTTRLFTTPIPLPHKRNSRRRDDFRRSYTDSLIAEVAAHYQADIATFGYEFENQTNQPALANTAGPNLSDARMILAFEPRSSDSLGRSG